MYKPFEETEFQKLSKTKDCISAIEGMLNCRKFALHTYLDFHLF